MRVRDRMSTHLFTIAPESKLADAFDIMTKQKIRHLPILDRGKLIGMITSWQIYSAMPSADASEFQQRDFMMKTKVRDIAGEEGEVITVHMDSYIEQAAIIMMDSKASGMPVVDDDFRLVGMLSVIDILKAMVEMLGVNRKGTRINLRVDHNPEVIRDIAEILAQHNTTIENIVEMETKEGKDLLILRIESLDYKPIIEEFKAKGFEVESIIAKQ